MHLRSVPKTNRLRKRANHSGLHGRQKVAKQRYVALLLIVTGLIRVLAWTSLIVMYLAGVPFTASLFKSVAFVAVISLYANAATDFGQVCASLAQLTAGDAHRDSEHTRERLGIDFSLLESDVAQLAELQPGPEAWTLAADIRERLHNQGA